MIFAMWVGVSSYSPISLGRPALGCRLIGISDILFRDIRCGLSCSAPKAQLKPIEQGFACFTEVQKASAVWPDKVLPELSVIVPEIISGISFPTSSHLSR